MHHVLLQTTIEGELDDWNIDRFSRLKALLESIPDEAGNPRFRVTARNRDKQGQPDPILSRLDETDIDQLWLFAVDVGDGLTSEDCEGISRFRRAGRAMLIARDHMDLGCSICNLAGVGAANHFHTHNLDPDETRRCIDDTVTTAISWPNYHTGSNGDYQRVEPVGDVHPVLRDPESANGVLLYLPSHPHEGAISAPVGDASSRVILRGRSQLSGRTVNLAVAFEGSEGGGRAIVESTFHHFADYNWSPASGCPTFVSESPGDGLARFPEAMRSTHRYVRNVAEWLAGSP